MKRNFIRNSAFLATVLVAFAGVSCEKHRWTDDVVEIQEKIYDDDGNVVEVKKTKVVKEKGAVRFFKEDHGSDKATSHSKPAHPAKPAQNEGKH